MNKRQTSAGACGELDRTAVCTATRSAVEMLPAVLETIVLKTVALKAVLVAAVLMLLVPSCSKLEAERAEVTAGDEAIVLRPTVEAIGSPWGLKGITTPTKTDSTLNASYSIYTSAYYTNPDFPMTDGNYFVGVKADSPWNLDYNWPAAEDGSKSRIDFLSIATESAVYDISSIAEWGCYDGEKFGNNATYGVRINVPNINDNNSEILYATASQRCTDKAPVKMNFKHTQCCLEFYVHANLENVLRLDKIVVNDAYSSGELFVQIHPLEGLNWNTTSSEPHGVDVPGVLENTPLTPSKVKYSMVLIPQSRRDLTFYFQQLSFPADATTDPYDLAYSATETERWQRFSVEPVYTTTSEAKRWEAGKKYIFDVTIKFGEVIIQPSIVEWTDADDQKVPV